MRTCPICDCEYEDSNGSCPYHAASDIYDPLVGASIRDRYLIQEIIGRGAMGVVYKAIQTTDNKEVAVKVLHSHLACDGEAVRRFHDEARAASSLMHPNIVRLFDVGTTPGGQPYIAMELLPGISLADHIKTKGYLSTGEALPIIRQVCEALADAHSNGVVHRDIKPANIMLCNRFGQENFVMVLDFSIAKVIQRVSDVDSTTPGLIFGSPAYMSPERFMGRGGDFRSDIYSLGIIMFQMLAGETPFKAGDLYTLMNAHVKENPPSVKDLRPESDVPDDLEAAIARALSKKPEDRHDNMKQLLMEIYQVYRNGAERSTMQRIQESQQSFEPSLQLNHAASTTGDTALNAGTASARQSARQRSDCSSYEICPGGTPATNIQSSSGNQKSDSSILSNATDLAASGRWKNSAIKDPSERRPAIRPAGEKQRIPLEFIALVLVIACGVAAICATQQTAENTQRTEELLRAGNLEATGSSLQSWRVHGVKNGDQERFARLCLELGHSYMSRQLLSSAAIYFEMVPESSHLYPEAQTLARKCHKAFNL